MGVLLYGPGLSVTGLYFPIIIIKCLGFIFRRKKSGKVRNQGKYFEKHNFELPIVFHKCICTRGGTAELPDLLRHEVNLSSSDIRGEFYSH